MKKILFTLSILLSTSIVAQDRSIRPSAGPAPEIHLGSTESFQMDNGLKVFVVENHKLPIVSISLQFKSNPDLEGDAVGIASIAGAMVGTATTSRTKDEIDASVDYIGASLRTSASGIYASSLTKHLPVLMELFSDVVLNSEFTQEEFDKSITQNQSSLASAKDSPDAIASNVRNVLTFGKAHSYGELMTESSLENISLEACQNYFNTYFKPSGAYLAIVGDINVEEAKLMLEKHIGSWEASEVPNATYTSSNAPKENKVALVNKAGAVQSVINITYPFDLHPSSDDALAVKVLNNILGGGSAARLFRNLREDKAYTYGAYSNMDIDELGSSFNASAKVRNEVTDSAIVEFFKEIKLLRNEKVGQEELQGVLNNMSGKFAIALESASTVARFAINVDHLGFADNHYATYLQRLSAITVDDIHAAAQKYLKPNNTHIIVVGDAENLADKLVVFGEVTLYDSYGVEKSDLKPVPASVNSETVVSDYITALGGAKKLNKLNSLQFNYSVAVTGAPMSLDMEVLQQKPNSFSMTMSTSGMTVQRQFSNGTQGFNDGMQGKSEMTAEELDDAQAQYQIASELNYFDLYTAELKGIDVLDGEEVYVMVRTDKDGQTATEYYSVASAFLVKSESTIETPQGEMAQSTSYKDYQSVKGYSFPNIIVQNVAGQVIDMSLKTVLVNKKIDSSKFE